MAGVAAQVLQDHGIQSQVEEAVALEAGMEEEGDDETPAPGGASTSSATPQDTLVPHLRLSRMCHTSMWQFVLCVQGRVLSCMCVCSLGRAEAVRVVPPQPVVPPPLPPPLPQPAAAAPLPQRPKAQAGVEWWAAPRTPPKRLPAATRTAAPPALPAKRAPEALWRHVRAEPAAAAPPPRSTPQPPPQPPQAARLPRQPAPTGAPEGLPETAPTPGGAASLPPISPEGNWWHVTIQDVLAAAEREPSRRQHDFRDRRRQPTEGYWIDDLAEGILDRLQWSNPARGEEWCQEMGKRHALSIVQGWLDGSVVVPERLLERMPVDEGPGGPLRCAARGFP